MIPHYGNALGALATYRTTVSSHERVLCHTFNLQTGSILTGDSKAKVNKIVYNVENLVADWDPICLTSSNAYNMYFVLSTFAAWSISTNSHSMLLKIAETFCIVRVMMSVSLKTLLRLIFTLLRYVMSLIYVNRND